MLSLFIDLLKYKGRNCIIHIMYGTVILNFTSLCDQTAEIYSRLFNNYCGSNISVTRMSLVLEQLWQKLCSLRLGHPFLVRQCVLEDPQKKPISGQVNLESINLSELRKLLPFLFGHCLEIKVLLMFYHPDKLVSYHFCDAKHNVASTLTALRFSMCDL